MDGGECGSVFSTANMPDNGHFKKGNVLSIEAAQSKRSSLAGPSAATRFFGQRFSLFRFVVWIENGEIHEIRG
jgi:hypothetical protein